MHPWGTKLRQTFQFSKIRVSVFFVPKKLSEMVKAVPGVRIYFLASIHSRDVSSCSNLIKAGYKHLRSTTTTDCASTWKLCSVFSRTGFVQKWICGLYIVCKKLIRWGEIFRKINHSWSKNSICCKICFLYNIMETPWNFHIYNPHRTVDIPEPCKGPYMSDL